MLIEKIKEQTCGENQYACRKVSPNQPRLRCIPNEWKCNGLRDCEENDDEDDCHGVGQNSGSQQQQQYGNNDYNQPQYHRPQVDQQQQQQQQCLPGQHTCYGTGIHISMPLKCLERQFVW